MKKYIFLIFLFIIYVYLITNKTENVSFSLDQKKDVSYFKLDFKNGISSRKIQNIFKEYKLDYLLYKINDYDLYCDDINICIKNVYSLEIDEFKLGNMYEGFRIDYIELIVSKQNLTKYLDKNNIKYKIYEL